MTPLLLTDLLTCHSVLKKYAGQKRFPTLRYSFLQLSDTYLFFAEKITIPFTEDADIENAITCLATLLAMRILFNDDIREKFANLSPTCSRIDVIEGVNNCLLIHDTYTSDYLSLAH